jgi:hypothetical protein
MQCQIDAIVCDNLSEPLGNVSHFNRVFQNAAILSEAD